MTTTSKALTATGTGSVALTHKRPHQLSLQKKDAIRAAGAFGERSEPIFCPRAGATGTVDWASEASLEIELQSPQKKIANTPYRKLLQVLSPVIIICAAGPPMAIFSVMEWAATHKH